MRPFTRRQKWWIWFVALLLAGMGTLALTVFIVRWTLRVTQLEP